MSKKICPVCLSLLCLLILTGCCFHNWQEATYEAPKTCSICGAVEGNPLILEAFPTDSPRYSGPDFLFSPEDFVILCNLELEGTGFTMELESVSSDGDAEYAILKDGEKLRRVSCDISYSGEFTNGEYMYMGLHLSRYRFEMTQNASGSSLITQEEKEMFQQLVAAIYRTVTIPDQEATYESMLENAETVSEPVGGGNQEYSCELDSGLRYTIWITEQEASASLFFIIMLEPLE